MPREWWGFSHDIMSCLKCDHVIYMELNITVNWDLFTKLPCQCMSCVKRLCPFLERSLVHNKWNKNVARCLKLKYINVCQLKCEHNRLYLMMLPLVTIFVSQQRIDIVASLLANGLPVFIWNGVCHRMDDNKKSLQKYRRNEELDYLRL